MVPELRGLGASLRMLKEGMAAELKGVPDIIAALNEALVPEVKEMKSHLSSAVRDFEEVKAFNKEMRDGVGANSSDPIDDSKRPAESQNVSGNGSANAAQNGQQVERKEPHDSWANAGQKPAGVDMGAGSQS